MLIVIQLDHGKIIWYRTFYVKNDTIYIQIRMKRGEFRTLNLLRFYLFCLRFKANLDLVMTIINNRGNAHCYRTFI